jgi:hypothetical protein
LTARLFSCTPLPWQELAIVGGMALVYLLVLDVIKVQYYKPADKDASRLLDVHTSAQVKHEPSLSYERECKPPLTAATLFHAIS